jgi:TatD DNase family protein
VLVDTHCHLDFDRFDDDRDQVLERALEFGIERILNPGIDLQSSHKAVQLSEKYSRVYASVGVHPNEALSWDESLLEALRDLTYHPKVVAIGEIGLDYYRDRSPKDLQRRVLRAQLELASERNLPVIIHNREATQDVLEQLVEWQKDLVVMGSPLADRPGVLHSYAYGMDSAARAMGSNFFIGITGPVTFRKAVALRETVANLPLEKLLVETDSPFLTPQPHRGKRNEPSYVRFVAQKIAELKNIDMDRLAQRTTSNADKLFNWREIS